MPDYEYSCRTCGKRFTVFLSYREYDQAEVACRHCSSREVSRRIGRVRVMRGGSGFSPEGMPDPAALESMGDDPAAMGRMMRQMSAETGEEMPAEMDEVVSRLERGERPEDIEKNMPDLGGDEALGDDL